MLVLDLISTTIATLSFLGAGSFLVYLVATEKNAPRFAESLVKIDASDFNLLVSVIIPARNEEQTIEDCLKSMAGQTHKNLEILVVDDSSTDNTCNVVRSFSETNKNIKLLQAGAKPRGWVGKGWACWKGYEASRGEFLLFVDADSVLAAAAIESSLKYALEKGIEMFSLSPSIQMKGVFAKAVLPMVTGAINLLYPMQKVNDKNSHRAYVFGTFVLVKRSVYTAIGGHEKVREEIVEDAAIARLAKSAGYNLRVERGPQFVSSQWESDPRDIYQGLERVTSTSVRSFGLISILNAVLLFFITLYPIIFVIVYAAIRTSNALLIGFIASVLSILIFLILDGFETKTISGKISLSACLYPIGSIFFIAAIVSTSIKVSRGSKIMWKGQGYVQPARKRNADKFQLRSDFR